jgi:hypothetical protein
MLNLHWPIYVYIVECQVVLFISVYQIVNVNK